MDLSAGVMWECLGVKDDSEGEGILNLLKAFNLRERKSVVKRNTIIKTRVNKGSGDSSGSGSQECDGYVGGRECGNGWY